MEIIVLYNGSYNGSARLEFLFFRMLDQMFFIVAGITDVGMGLSEIMNQSGNPKLEMLRKSKGKSVKDSRFHQGGVSDIEPSVIPDEPGLMALVVVDVPVTHNLSQRPGDLFRNGAEGRWELSRKIPPSVYADSRIFIPFCIRVVENGCFHRKNRKIRYNECTESRKFVKDIFLLLHYIPLSMDPRIFRIRSSMFPVIVV